MSNETTHIIRQLDATIRGRHCVARQTEMTVRGVGRVRYLGLVTNTRLDESWIDALDRHGRLRSLRLDRIVTVHTKTKTRGAA